MPGAGRRVPGARRLLVSLCVGSFLSGFLLASPLLAQSASEIRAQAKQIGAEVAAQRSGGTLNVAAQQSAIDRLGKLVLAFIDLCDRVANTGSEGRRWPEGYAGGRGGAAGRGALTVGGRGGRACSASVRA